MICSMTGYGSAQKSCPQWTVRAEARSVNHPQLKVSVRLPDMLRLKEGELTGLVRGRLARGHVTLSVRCNFSEDALRVVVDRRALRGYVKLARELAAAEDVPLHVEAGSLLSLPEVLGTDSMPDEVLEELWPFVLDASEGALEGLIEMRRTEGRNLARQMEDICERVLRRTRAVDEGGECCVRATQRRLQERLERLLDGADVPLDSNALAREVALLADRSDVSEEVARMASHLQQFRQTLGSEGEAVGKKLEFLVQEMAREADTMTAKLPSSELVQEAVEIKTDVHRLREQARNVE